MRTSDILLLGSGSLARAICYALAAICTEDISVTVLSRAAQRAEDLCYIANTRAALTGSPARFQACEVPDYTRACLAPAFARIAPALVLNCASLQSPWEAGSAPSAWTDLLARAGFGLTLPLQSFVPIEAATAVKEQATPPLFLNASFPDAVNPVLHALGLPVFCGIGNVALLAASLRQALNLGPAARVQVLGHHWHLYPPGPEVPEALAWLDGVPLTGVAAMLQRQRATPRAELNQVNGLTTAQLLIGIVTGQKMQVSVPGPRGLAGGYPVTIKGRSIATDLPEAWPLDRAKALNARWAREDGVAVFEDGSVLFSEKCRNAVCGHLPEMATPVSAALLVEVRARLLTLREQLRRQV